MKNLNKITTLLIFLFLSKSRLLLINNSGFLSGSRVPGSLSSATKISPLNLPDHWAFFIMVKDIPIDIYKSVPEEVNRQAAKIYEEDCGLAINWGKGLILNLTITRQFCNDPDLLHKYFGGYRKSDERGHFFNLQTGRLLAFFNNIYPYLTRRQNEVDAIFELKATSDREFRKSFQGNLKKHRQWIIERIYELRIENGSPERSAKADKKDRDKRDKSHIKSVPQRIPDVDELTMAGEIFDENCFVNASHTKIGSIKISFVRDDDEEVNWLWTVFGGNRAKSVAKDGTKLEWLTFYGAVLDNFLSMIGPFTRKWKDEVRWMQEMRRLMGKAGTTKVPRENMARRKELVSLINAHWKDKKDEVKII